MHKVHDNGENVRRQLENLAAKGQSIRPKYVRNFNQDREAMKGNNMLRFQAEIYWILVDC